MDSLASCLDAIFEGKILEARKYITVVTLSLKQGSTTAIFVSELVERLLKYGAALNSEQFELLCRLVNSAIINERMAMSMLPLAAVFYQVHANNGHTLVWERDLCLTILLTYIV